MKSVLPVMTFVVRHFLMVPLAILAGCVLWTVGYVILLLIAVIWNQDVGGPLAYPAGIVMVIISAIVIGWGMFAPACAIGAISCRMIGWPRLAAIPIVFASGFLFSYLLYWVFVELVSTHSMPSFWIVLKNFTLFLSVPLGAYWWITEGPGAVFDAFRRWIVKRVDRKNSP
ncbi:MAG: hypothetical protein H8M99_15700 [Gloeobacteraceae cyanobacterium ES-bin-144]|nr:hypothetical protein [Verrucomicrobiales bacterium]